MVEQMQWVKSLEQVLDRLFPPYQSGAMLEECNTTPMSLTYLVMLFLFPHMKKAVHIADVDPQMLEDPMLGLTPWISESEQRLVSWALDLTFRLALHNPHLDRPRTQAEAVVLIDGLDNGLHPQRQWALVEHGTDLFPRCQFIATTQSPILLSQVPANRVHCLTSVQDLRSVDDPQVYQPAYTQGLDVNRLLEEVMDSPVRPAEVQALHTRLVQAIAQEDGPLAHGLLRRMIEQVGAHDPEVVRYQTLLDFLDLERDLGGG